MAFLERSKSIRPLWLILVSFLVVGTLYTLWLPLGETNDEAEHFALVRFISRHGRPPVTQPEREEIGIKGDAAPLYHSLLAASSLWASSSDGPSIRVVDEKISRAIPSDGLGRNQVLHTEDEAMPYRGVVLGWHICRLVSLAMGAVSVWLSYAVARTLLPGRPRVAAASALVTAFTPRFLINSSVINDDNLLVPLAGGVLLCLLKVAAGDERPKTRLLLGVLLGLGAITKYSALALVPASMLVLVAARPKRVARDFAQVFGPMVLVCGWWYVLLLARFNRVGELGLIGGLLAPLGDPVLTVGASRLSHAAAADFTFLDWAAMLFKSYWFEYAWQRVLAPGWVYLLFGVGVVAAAAGLIRELAAWKRGGGRARPEIAVLVMYVLLFASLVAARYFALSSPETAQGRHVYPAIFAVSFFLALGLDSLVRWWGLPVAGLLVPACVVLPIAFIRPVFFPYLPVQGRPLSGEIESPLGVEFAPGLYLEGYTLPDAPVRAGGLLPITLYWHAEKETTADYLVTVALLEGEEERMVACRAGYPLDGKYPTQAWEAGDWVRDGWLLPLPANLPAGDDYAVVVTTVPLRGDSASALPDASGLPVEARAGRVQVEAGGAPAGGVSIWAGGEQRGDKAPLRPGLRGSVTVIMYGDGAYDARLVDGAGGRWPPLDLCGVREEGHAVRSFVVTPDVLPAPYSLEVGGDVVAPGAVVPQTRPRIFTEPGSWTYTPFRVVFGEELEILGYSLDSGEFMPGEQVEVTLYWRSLAAMSEQRIMALHLLDGMVDMRMWAQRDQVPGNDYPHVLWAPGEYVRETYGLYVPPDTPPGLFDLELSVYDHTRGSFDFLPALHDGAESNGVVLQRVRVLAPESRPEEKIGASFGEGSVILSGYTLGGELRPGGELRLTLYWRAGKPLAEDYTVFAQLVGPDGKVWTQKDNWPQQGRFPTSAWGVGDSVVDGYVLRLPVDMPAGEYRLLVGMYLLESGERLAASGTDGSPIPDNAVMLAAPELK